MADVNVSVSAGSGDGGALGSGLGELLAAGDGEGEAVGDGPGPPTPGVGAWPQDGQPDRPDGDHHHRRDRQLGVTCSWSGTSTARG